MRVQKIALLLLSTAASAQDVLAPSGQMLPTGQALTPLAAPGTRFEPLIARTGPNPAYVADGASAVAVSPDGREMLVLTSGYNRFNGADGKVVAAQSNQYVFRYAVGKRGSRWLQTLTVPNSYGGIAWRPDGRGFVVGGGVDDAVYVFARRGGSFARPPSGIATNSVNACVTNRAVRPTSTLRPPSGVGDCKAMFSSSGRVRPRYPGRRGRERP